MTAARTPLWQYALGVLTFLAIFPGLPVAIWLLHQRIDRNLNRHVDQALNVTALDDKRKRSA